MKMLYFLGSSKKMSAWRNVPKDKDSILFKEAVQVCREVHGVAVFHDLTDNLESKLYLKMSADWIYLFNESTFILPGRLNKEPVLISNHALPRGTYNTEGTLKLHVPTQSVTMSCCGISNGWVSILQF